MSDQFGMSINSIQCRRLLRRMSGPNSPKPRDPPNTMSAYDYKKGEINELKTLMRNRAVERDPKKRREVIKKVIGYQSIGIDVSKLFTEMAMAVATTDLVIKKMVYLYVCTLSNPMS